MIDTDYLETYEEEYEYECVECGEIYSEENSCPNCGSSFAKISSDDDECELQF